MSLSLTEELLLLAVHDEKGSVILSSTALLPYGISASLLLDLKNLEKINFIDDKVVLFDRRDIVAQSSSYWHLWNKLDGNYKESYVPKEISKRDLSQIMTRFTLWKDQLLHISRGLGQPIIYLEDVQHFLMANVFTTNQGFARSKDNPIKVSNFDPDLWYNPDHFSPSRKLAKQSDVNLRKVFPHRKTIL